ncbi:MAG: FkbM family methyltransferase [Mucilaginibacter polytrichastri]|nr:FkbM family methyltransferase [Mucilaginibacter polytrichastri]
MNWKLFIGRTLRAAEEKLIGSNASFISKNFPYGRSWTYDLLRIMPQAKTLIDVGANLGEISLESRKRYPGSVIYAIEPVAATFKDLGSKVSKYPNIRPQQIALGAEDHVAEILIQADHTVNSLSVAAANGQATEKIVVKTLDGFAAENALSQIDVLKIDVEGYENQVLKGAEKLLQKELIKSICIEVGYERMPAKTHFTDVDAQLTAHGFVLCGIYDLQRNLVDKRRLWYSNNLYIHQSALNP